MSQSDEEKLSAELSLSMPAGESRQRQTPLNGLGWVALVGAAALLAFLIYHSLTGAQAAPVGGEHHGPPEGY